METLKSYKTVTTPIISEVRKANLQKQGTALINLMQTSVSLLGYFANTDLMERQQELLDALRAEMESLGLNS